MMMMMMTAKTFFWAGNGGLRSFSSLLSTLMRQNFREALLLDKLYTSSYGTSWHQKERPFDPPYCWGLRTKYGVETGGVTVKEESNQHLKTTKHRGWHDVQRDADSRHGPSSGLVSTSVLSEPIKSRQLSVCRFTHAIRMHLNMRLKWQDLVIGSHFPASEFSYGLITTTHTIVHFLKEARAFLEQGQRSSICWDLKHIFVLVAFKPLLVAIHFWSDHSGRW